MSKPHNKETGEEEKLATTNAQLIVSLGNCSNIPVSDPTAYVGLYCIMTFDKQQVLSDNSRAKVTATDNGGFSVSCEWTELIKFDVTQGLSESYLSLSIWGKNSEKTGCLGTCRIPLNNLEFDVSHPLTVPIKLSKEKIFVNVSTSNSPSGNRSVGSWNADQLGKSPARIAIKRDIHRPESNSDIHYQIQKQGSGNDLLNGRTSLDLSSSSSSTTSNTTCQSTQQQQQGSINLTVLIQRQKKRVSENDFEKLRVIGRGTFGKVFQARKRDTGRIYAMKVLKKDHVVKNNAVKHTMSENHVLKNINHPFIVNLKYAFQTKSHLYMVIDYLNGGELFYHLTHDDYFPEARAKFYAAEVVSALGYLHDHNILYRDLKPENLILDMHGHITLVDFGLCKVGWMPSTKTHTFCGSAEYLAPELLKGKGYGKEVDWWALGTLIYEMLSGLPPFWDEDEEYMQKKIISAPLKMHKYFSAEVKDLIKGLLCRDPEQRLGSGPKGTENIKNHPWFSSIDWAALDRREETPPFVPHLKNEQDLPYVEEDVLRELPALSLTNQSVHLDQDLFAGFSYDSEAIVPRPTAGTPKRAARRDSNATPQRRKRADDAGDSSDSESESTLTKDMSNLSLGSKQSQSGSNSDLKNKISSQKPECDMIFSLEDQD